MKRICQRGSEVIIWLGEDATTTNSLEKIQSIVEAEVEMQDLSPWSSLSQNPYWMRLWTVQEILLARKRTVMSGNTTLSWNTLSRWYQHNKQQIFIHKVDRFSTEGDLMTSADPLFNLLWHTSQRDDHNDSDSLMFRIDHAISYFSWHLCADPMDKIYGLLGIIDGGEMLNVEYSLQLHQLFEKVIHFGLVLWRIDLKLRKFDMTTEPPAEFLHALWQLGDGMKVLETTRLTKIFLRNKVQQKWRAEFV